MTIEQKQVVVPGASRGDYLIKIISHRFHGVLGFAESHRD
jgi:hypothetical protein